jgi:hypothetical protein
MLSIWMIGAGARDGGRQVKGGRKRVRKPAFELEMDGEGMPLLPDITDTKLEEKKAIVRAFLTSHYREFLVSSSEKLLTVRTQGYVPGRTRWLCLGVPSCKVRMTSWPRRIFQRMLT